MVPIYLNFTIGSGMDGVHHVADTSFSQSQHLKKPTIEVMPSFAGHFRLDNAIDTDEEMQPWQCPICSTTNKGNDEVSPARCRVCKRLRKPQWLYLEEWDCQICLASRLWHTSPGDSKSLSVVVAINYVQKFVTLLRMKVKRAEFDNGDENGAITFHETVVNELQVQEQLLPMDADEEDGNLLDKYGICGDCRGVFRIEQGDLQSQYANEERVVALLNEIGQLSSQKLIFAREKAYARVVECSEEIKFATKQLQLARRELEFLNPVFCPFCGWYPPNEKDKE